MIDYELKTLYVRANQVWITDITYIKIAGVMVYLAAVIDWYFKAVLSFHIIFLNRVTYIVALLK